MAELQPEQAYDLLEPDTAPDATLEAELTTRPAAAWEWALTPPLEGEGEGEGEGE